MQNVSITNKCILKQIVTLSSKHKFTEIHKQVYHCEKKGKKRIKLSK